MIAVSIILIVCLIALLVVSDNFDRRIKHLEKAMEGQLEANRMIANYLEQLEEDQNED